jgi:peptidoglycan/LPS O-acetylase OafA/YrhL
MQRRRACSRWPVRLKSLRIYASSGADHLRLRCKRDGVVAVALLDAASVICAAFGGQTNPLIPLFAIGVFLAFTLAQSGMVAHWWRHRERGWRAALGTNLLGAVLSAVVVVIAAITKLTQGAWVVVVLVPLIVLGCQRVHAHYRSARRALTPRPGSAQQTRSPIGVAPPRLAPVVSERLAEA